MRKQVQIAVAVLLAAIGGVATWEVLGDREPVYQGKPLSVWLERYITHGSYHRRSARAGGW